MNHLTTKVLNQVSASQRFFSIGIGIASCICLFTLRVLASSTPETQIHITLLGQPCLLQGPFDETTLKAIHLIGPAQIYPTISSDDFKLSRQETKRALEKIKTITGVPSSLDRYREKLGKRLEAQLSFMDELETAQKKHDPLLMMKAAKRFLKPADLNAFEILLKKMKNTVKNPSQYREALDQAFDYYSDKIEPDPEEEFHRTIKKLNVQYTCSFDENEDLNGE